MSKKTKNKLIEIIIKSGMIITLALGIIGFILDSLYGDGQYTKVLWPLVLAQGIMIMILIYKFPHALERPKVKAYEFPLNIYNYDDFIKYLDDNIYRINYKKFHYFGNNKELSHVYYKRKGKFLEYYSVYHFDEIKESSIHTLNYCDKLLDGFFDMYYLENKKNIYFRFTYIIWIDKETKHFENLINTNLTQEDYDGFLLVGVSPSKQLIYVANQKDGNNKFLYWKLRKKFLKVMNLKMKDRIRNK